MENIFEWLQIWYLSQCDGDWEHENGITIDTVDNPGWFLTINLTGTKLEKHTFSPIKIEVDKNNWYFCSKKNGNFEASGGPLNLIEILNIFRTWTETCE
jgi:Immunity protein 53